jgi:hypothetical protein
MRKAGISDAAIRRVTQDNPRRFLTFVPKQAWRLRPGPIESPGSGGVRTRRQ